MTIELDERKTLLVQFKEKVKSLPIKERKPAAMLCAIFEKIVNLELGRDSKNDELFAAYSSKIEQITEQIDAIVEGKKAIQENDIEFWKKEGKQEFNYTPEEIQKSQKPIKGFWKNYIINLPVRHGEQDAQILEHLTKMEIINTVDEKNEDLKETKLICHFSPNEFFENESLTVALTEMNEEIVKSVGTEIAWKKNPTVEKVKKTQKNKKSGQKRVVEKEKQLVSFFEIFNDFNKEDDEEERSEINDDDIPINIDAVAEVIDQIAEGFPYALEYYLGLHEEDEDDLEGIDEEDDDEESEDEEEGPKRAKKLKKSRKNSENVKEVKNKDQEEAAPTQNKQECKQQ